MSELKYLELLSQSFPNIAETSTEIINLQAILNLPKGTEHFLTDVHGEYEAFSHVLRNGSGSIRQKIEDIFQDTLTELEKKELATVIYYPDGKYDMALEEQPNMNKWIRTIIYRLLKVCKNVSSKYTRSKVRKSMPKDFEYIMQELLYESREEDNKRDYVESIIDTLISISYTKQFIVAMSELIRRLTIDHLHLVGDIYDRGPAPHLIMDCLLDYHHVDIQWGNHDMLWIGAGVGNKACIANVIRICCRYNNNDILEEAYGINLLPLATFAMKYYGKDPCKSFRPKEGMDSDLVAQMHKAISIIQFKVEGLFSERNPNLQMKDREILKEINYERGTILWQGKEYPLNDTFFPTIDPKKPLELLEEEAELLDRLKDSFMNSEKLQRHLRFLFSHGSLYLCCNSNLLYHACVPLTKDGKLAEVEIEGVKYKGKAYLDKVDTIARQAFFDRVGNEKDKRNRDFLWYLWCGELSPLFGKDVMRTFERYFIDDKSTHEEHKNPYYTFINQEETCNMILSEFGLNPKISHIINGHVPVKVKKGESPVKANGKLFVIDGGFARAYQKTTGIAGYTLIYNSYGIKLVSHAPFESKEKALKEGADILSSIVVEDKIVQRKRVKDTDIGKKLQGQVNDLKKLLLAYRKGIIQVK